MRVFVVLCLVAGGAVVLVKAGSFSAWATMTTENADGSAHVRCYGTCVTDASAGASPLLQDVAALGVAGDSPALRRAGVAFNPLLAHVHRLGHTAGAALLWQRGLRPTRALANEESLLADRLRAAPIRTPGGEACRRAAVRLILRYAWALDRLQRGVAMTGRPTWAVVRRFDTAKRRSDVSYAGEVVPCLRSASGEERRAVARAMGVA